jgi:hypothetical protein
MATHAPAQTPGSPAIAGDGAVWILASDVQPEARERFESFVSALWEEGARYDASHPVDSRVFQRTRVLHPVHANGDGTFTYVFLLDSTTPEPEFSLIHLLQRAYAPAEASQRYETFRELLSGPERSWVVRQPGPSQARELQEVAQHIDDFAYCDPGLEVKGVMRPECR